MKDIELPPLPEPTMFAEYWASDMHAYARAAVEGDRAQRVTDGYDQGSAECMAAVQEILDGKDRGDGVANEPWESIRRRLISLVAPAPAQQEPDCQRCKGSGEDPEGYFDQSRGPDGDTYDGPCRDCAGTGAAQHQEPPQQERKPMTYREIADATSEWAHVRSDYTIGIIRAVERHHGIKE